MSAASLNRSFARLALASGSRTATLAPSARLAVPRLALTALPKNNAPSSFRTYAVPASGNIRLGNLQPGQPTKTVSTGPMILLSLRETQADPQVFWL